MPQKRTEITETPIVVPQTKPDTKESNTPKNQDSKLVNPPEPDVPKPHKASEFLGTWKNTNPQSKRFQKLVFSPEGNNAKMEKNQKHQVHNLIILDESGSMVSIKGTIIQGFNEIVQT